jgi:hypothetical protein
VDFRLFRELAPDHQPEAVLKETIDELRAGLEAIHFSDRDYRNSSFMRLKMLKTLHQSGFITENLEWKTRNVPK